MSTPLKASVQTQTTGNLRAEIISVKPSDRHPIKGTIQTPEGTVKAEWDEDGYCLDNLPECNLNADDPTLSEVVDAAITPDA